jgi:putative peptidoglycan lipid II flippase
MGKGDFHLPRETCLDKSPGLTVYCTPMASTIIKPPRGPVSPPPGESSSGAKPPTMARAAGAVMAATLLSRVLGQIRDIVIAHQLGASVEADAYTAAFKIPDLLMYLVAGGALASIFIPVFKEHLQLNKPKTAWQIFSIVATVTALVAGLFVVIAEIWTPEFVRLLNPGYDSAMVALTVPLTRIVLPAQIFFMLGGLLMGTLNARGQFLLPALAPSIYNLGIIFGAAVLYPLGLGPAGMMWGALGGAFVGNFALQVVLVARTGGRYKPSLAVLHPGAIKVWKMLLPILLGVSLPNVDQIINSYFASELPHGSQASLQYAVRLMLIPIGIFAQAMGIAILPAMSGLAAEGKRKEFRATVSQALRTILFVTVPASALLCVLATPLITLMLQSGEFTAHDTSVTAMALRFYSIGIFAWSAQAILTRGFYALQDTRTPVVSGTVMTVLFIGMNWLVVHFTSWGVGGLALATSAAAILHMLVMYVFLRRRLRGIQDGLLLVSVVKTLGATAALCGGVWVMQAGVLTFLPPALSAKLAALIVLGLAGGVGLFAFLLAARLLRMAELQSVIDMVRRRRA